MHVCMYICMYRLNILDYLKNNTQLFLVCFSKTVYSLTEIHGYICHAVQLSTTKVTQ